MGFIICIIYLGGLYLIIILISKIIKTIEEVREKSRDDAAREVLGDLDILNVVDDYRNKLKHIGHIRFDPINKSIERLRRDVFGRDASLINKCPKCGSGYLMIRKGKYGKFLGCTGYPKCKYTKDISEARKDQKKSINERIIDDMQKIYS